MKVSRREAFVALGGAAFLTGCSRLASNATKIGAKPALPPKVSDDPKVALINRFGFGPNNESLSQLREHEQDVWIETQLDPDGSQSAFLSYSLGRLDINNFSPWDLRSWDENVIISQLQQAALLQAVFSPWQIQERMVDFWTNHFNIFARKGLGAYRKPTDEREVIRKHALGKFSDMVKASSKSAAMLIYLDQQNSNASQPNENYARELLELHTLGVNGGYTQKDVMEVARCFTGYTEERRFLHKKGDFRFRPELHDFGEKTILGKTISARDSDKNPEEAVADGERVVDIVCNHPSTAKFIAKKLCRYFIGENQPAAEAAVAKTFSETGGDIKSMVRTLIKEFQANPQPLVKRPYDYVASALRATQAHTDCGIPVLDRLESMGQPLYLWPMPDGYPVDTDSWTGSMLARWNFAYALAHGGMDGTSINIDLLTQEMGDDDAESVVFRRHANDNLVASVSPQIDSLPLTQQVAATLASPEFQWK